MATHQTRIRNIVGREPKTLEEIVRIAGSRRRASGLRWRSLLLMAGCVGAMAATARPPRPSVFELRDSRPWAR
jgi:hypothetical protein